MKKLPRTRKAVPREIRDPQIILFSSFKVSDEEIGKKFGIKACTVAHDRERIFKQLRVKDLANALAIYTAQKKLWVTDIMCVYYTL